MPNESSGLRRNIESFKLSASKLSGKINSVSDIWKDSNYVALQKQIGELTRDSRTTIATGEKTCASVDRFFRISEEKI